MLADLRHAGRALVARPALTTAIVLILALAIGATTAIFSVVDAVLLRAAPVSDLDRLVMVWETDRDTGTYREPASVPDLIDFRRESHTLDALEGVMGAEVTLTPESGDPTRLAALAVTDGLLPIVGARPVIGRTFGAADVAPRAPGVVLISESLWTRSFGRRPDILGHAITLDERSHAVVGVMPDRADFGMLQMLAAADYARGYADRGARATADVWLPLPLDPREYPRSTHPVLTVGVLAAGAGVAAAQEELASLAAVLERQYPENKARGVFVEPFEHVVFGRVRPALLMLWGAVGLVLVVACANVASLLLAHGRSRAREIAVRRAIGAGHGRLARQYLAESLLLILPAFIAGIALAVGIVRLLVASAPAYVPRLDDVAVDVRVLLMMLAVAAAATAVFAALPLAQALTSHPQASLTGEGGRGIAGGRAGRRVQNTLVAVEMALAVVLVAGSALLVRSFWQILAVDPGFRAAGVVKAEYQLPSSRYPVDLRQWPNLSAIHGFTTRLLDAAAAIPGVEAAAVSGTHPLDPGFTNSFEVEGREAESEQWPELSIRSVTPGYFEVTGLKLLRGRLLAEGDTTSGPPVMVINEAAAARFFAGREPIGARIRFWGTPRTVVGVVANEKFQGLTNADPLAGYAPFAQAPGRFGGVLLVRAAGTLDSVEAAIPGAVRAIDPGLAVYGIEPLADTVGRSIGQQRFAMWLLGCLAALAAALAAIGIHGVLSYGVAERRRELGIRAALGARRGQLAWLVVGEGLGLAAVGIVTGLAIALAAGRALSSLLYGISATDATTYALVVIGLTAIALAATWLPARRASRVDPALLLRE
jgi:putative ABC transport system permease protein